MNMNMKMKKEIVTDEHELRVLNMFRSRKIQVESDVARQGYAAAREKAIEESVEDGLFFARSLLLAADFDGEKMKNINDFLGRDTASHYWDAMPYSYRAVADCAVKQEYVREVSRFTEIDPKKIDFENLKKEMESVYDSETISDLYRSEEKIIAAIKVAQRAAEEFLRQVG